MEKHALVVVDDMIQVNSNVFLKEFLMFLRTLFSITDNCPVRWFLGVAHDHYKTIVNILAGHTAYLDSALEMVNISKIALKQTLVESGINVSLSVD